MQMSRNNNNCRYIITNMINDMLYQKLRVVLMNHYFIVTAKEPKKIKNLNKIKFLCKFYNR